MFEFDAKLPGQRSTVGCTVVENLKSHKFLQLPVVVFQVDDN